MAVDIFYQQGEFIGHFISQLVSLLLCRWHFVSKNFHFLMMIDMNMTQYRAQY